MKLSEYIDTVYASQHTVPKDYSTSQMSALLGIKYINVCRKYSCSIDTSDIEHKLASYLSEFSTLLRAISDKLDVQLRRFDYSGNRVIPFNLKGNGYTKCKESIYKSRELYVLVPMEFRELQYQIETKCSGKCITLTLSNIVTNLCDIITIFGLDHEKILNKAATLNGEMK